MKKEIARKKRPLTTEEKESISKNYGIEITNSTPFGEGIRSNTLLLETDQEKKVVKVYPNNFSRELIEFQAEACNFMRANNTPVPEIYPNNQGRYATPIDGTHYVIMEHKKGSFPNPNNPKIIETTFTPLFQALHALARFNPSKIYIAPELKRPLSEQLEELQQTIKRKEHTIDRTVREYHERLTTIYEQTRERIKKLQIPRQLILGDYNLGSLLIDHKKPSIIDFDRIHEQISIFDIMHCIDNLFIDKESPNKNLEDRVNWQKLRQTAKFCGTHYPQFRDQIYAFPLMHQLLALTNLITTWNDTYQGDEDPAYFERTKKPYIRRLEIPTQLADRFIETLYEGCQEASERFN